MKMMARLFSIDFIVAADDDESFDTALIAALKAASGSCKFNDAILARKNESLGGSVTTPSKAVGKYEVILLAEPLEDRQSNYAPSPHGTPAPSH